MVWVGLAFLDLYTLTLYRETPSIVDVRPLESLATSNKSSLCAAHTTQSIQFSLRGIKSTPTTMVEFIQQHMAALPVFLGFSCRCCCCSFGRCDCHSRQTGKQPTSYNIAAAIAIVCLVFSLIGMYETLKIVCLGLWLVSFCCEQSSGTLRYRMCEKLQKKEHFVHRFSMMIYPV